MDRNGVLAQKGKPVLGYRRAVRLAGKATLVIVANNCPAAYVDALKRAGANVDQFEGNSRDLGVIYGKPFNVSVVTFVK
ncbi:MAG: ribosomal L7Ae/L30e/S12e/Gadd45 family protein [Candidatus Aenigmarchaeota archaeon]|nr:ribosomal L7Ae/L30e/S12e/Gadd45 family protein [Candidatus Aenigmarchaeota archaeon]